MTRQQNSKKCKPSEPGALAPREGELLPTPRRRMDLKTLKQVRTEMARVYREVRNGQMYSTEGARLVFMLAQIGKMVELSELEKRIEHLEALSNGES